MHYSDLRSKRVLVTGASSGIGAATAELFAAGGLYVGVHYFRTADRAEGDARQGARTRRRLSAAGGYAG